MERLDSYHSSLMRASKLMSSITSLWIVLSMALTSLVVTGVSGQDGFISIDCGGNGFTDGDTKVLWLNDEDYLHSAKQLADEGVAIPVNVNLDTSTAATRDNSDIMKTAMAFIPSIKSPSKYCYRIDVDNTTNYLVRVMFPTSTLTAQVPENQNLLTGYSTRFYFTVDSTFISTVELNLNETQTVELVATPLDNLMYICLVPLEGRSSMAAISSIELRSMGPDLDSRGASSESSSSRYRTNTGSPTSYLLTVARLNFGGNESSPAIRFPADSYDRLWYAAHNNIDVTSDFGSRCCDVPVGVVQSAWEGLTISASISFTLNIGAARTVHPIPSFYFTIYFYDSNPGKLDDTRLVDIFLEDGGQEILWEANVTIDSDWPWILWNYRQMFSSDFPIMRITPAERSTLPAMVNALELYGEFAAETQRTLQIDDMTIKGFLGAFGDLVDTSGDPCLPVPWNWLVCSRERPARVTQIDLSETALDGLIPVGIDRLTSLKSLDLSFNNLSGSLPSELFQIPELRDLNLQNNHFTGVVPDEIWSNNLKLGTVFLAQNSFTELNLTAWCQKVLATESLDANQPKVFLIGNQITKVILPSLEVLDHLTQPEPVSADEIVRTTPDRSGSILLGEDNPWCQSFEKGRATLVQRYLCRSADYQDFWEPWTVDRNSAAKRTVIIVSVISAILLLSMVCVLSVFLLRTWKRLRDLRQIQEALAKDDVRPPFFNYEELKAATGDFSEDNELGRGAFGAVYKAVLADGSTFAVKRLFYTEQNIADFLKEVVLITGIKHRNLIQLKGCCVRDRKRLLVYEYAENKNLAEALWGEGRSLALTWRQRFKICVDIARGLCYLHEELQPKIVHRDIKPQNILLDKEWNPKIADFGLARPAEEDATQYATRVGGTLGYFSPEYATLGIFSEKLDVYSYGVLVLEIVSGRRCINLSFQEDKIYLKNWAFNLFKEDKLLDIAENCLLATAPPDEVVSVLKTALSCLHESYDKRPSMSQVVNMLSGNLSDLVINLVNELKEQQRLHSDQLDESIITRFQEPPDDRPLLSSNSAGDPQLAIELSITIPR